jgi:hypothetical protein
MADHSKQTTVKQHTVPRCYLRGFADADQNFYSFNKRYKEGEARVDRAEYRRGPG